MGKETPVDEKAQNIRMLFEDVQSLLSFTGLLTATVASRIHRAAQPALLYLVPFTLLPLLTMAYLKVRSDRCWPWGQCSCSRGSRSWGLCVHCSPTAEVKNWCAAAPVGILTLGHWVTERLKLESEVWAWSKCKLNSEVLGAALIK